MCVAGRDSAWRAWRHLASWRETNLCAPCVLKRSKVLAKTPSSAKTAKEHVWRSWPELHYLSLTFNRTLHHLHSASLFDSHSRGCLPYPAKSIFRSNQIVIFQRHFIRTFSRNRIANQYKKPGISCIAASLWAAWRQRHVYFESH